MKGLVLCAGRGNRLRPFTFARAKHLIPVANKPIVLHVVESLARSGVADIGVVVNPATGEELREVLLENCPRGVRLSFIVQESPSGLAHALKAARRYLAETPFVTHLGDCLVSDGVARLLAEFATGRWQAVLMVAPVSNPGGYGVVVADEDRSVARLVEKPKEPFPSNLALVGAYVFGSTIHEAIDGLQPGPRGEYELTDAIQGLVDRGYRVGFRPLRGWWKDIGQPRDLLEANRLLLSGLAPAVQGEVADSRVVGAAFVEDGARVVRSTLLGPVHIARGALVEDSRIGPYTSVGRAARVVSTEVRSSIILDAADLSNLPGRLEGSVIGFGATVYGNDGGPSPRKLELILGDGSRARL